MKPLDNEHYKRTEEASYEIHNILSTFFDDIQEISDHNKDYLYRQLVYNFVINYLIVFYSSLIDKEEFNKSVELFFSSLKENLFQRIKTLGNT